MLVEKYLRTRRVTALNIADRRATCRKHHKKVTFSMEFDVITGFRTGCTIMDQAILINERFLKKIPGGRSNLNGDAGLVKRFLQIVLAVWMLLITAKMRVALHGTGCMKGVMKPVCRVFNKAEQFLEPVTDQHMARLKPSGVVRSPVVCHGQILSRI